jgi:hypothetical protein
VIHPAGSFRRPAPPQGERLAATVLNLPMNIALGRQRRTGAQAGTLRAALRGIEKENT